MPWRGPRYEGEYPSLGWGILRWGYDFLPSPSDSTAPLVLTDEQALLTLQWWAIDPVTGRFPYRRAILERAKGWGKSPLVGFWGLAELGGSTDDVSPGVLFDGWDANGEPVGRPWGTGGRPNPWIQVAAVSEGQTENTYGSQLDFLHVNDHRAARALGIDDGYTRLMLHGPRRGQLSPVTTSMAREGARTTFTIIDETHLYTPSNGGKKLASIVRRNAAKMGGRSVETTNSPVLGQQSVAEMSRKAAMGGSPGILYDAKRPAVEPQPDWPDAKLREALKAAYGDARWVDLDRLVAEIRDPANAWDDSLRFYFNIAKGGVNQAVDPVAYELLTRDIPVAPGTRIGVGFDGSINHDATFLRGCTESGHTFAIKSWVRPDDAPEDWQVPRADVIATVAWVFEFFNVGRFMGDPPKWWTEMQAWENAYTKDVVIQLDTNQHEVRFSAVCDRWITGIRSSIKMLHDNRGLIGPLRLPYTHDGDPTTVEHVKAAHLKKLRPSAEEADGRTRFVIVKGDDGRRIDGAVADALAYEAAMSMPPPEPPYTPFFLDDDDDGDDLDD